MSNSRQGGAVGHSRGSEEGFSPSSRSINHFERALGRSESRADKRTYWLSDDSAEGEDRVSIHLTDSNLSTDGSWLGTGLNRQQEDTPATPTLSSFVRRKERARSGEVGSMEVSADHKSSQSSGAVPQTAYWDVFRPSNESSPVTTETRSSRHNNVKMDSRKAPNLAMDKPLPTPPMFERTTSEAPFPKLSPVSSPSTTRPPLTSALSTRNRRKVTWRGKNCVIALPPDDKYSPTLLSTKDLEARLRKWDEEGYDTAGFGLTPAGEQQHLAGGQSRKVFPDPEDIISERRERGYKVRMPDLGKWKEYVKSLQEEKLRALGVSFGDEAVPRKKSPVSASMSRTSSQYPIHATSPPFPPSSVASNHVLQNNNMFSPPFNPSTNPSSQVGSVASPGSQYAGLHGNSHFPKHSIALGAYEQPFASPYQLPVPQPTPPVQGARSPQHYFATHQEGASPAIPANLQSLGAVLSPTSPASYDGNPQNHSDLLTRYRLQQQQLQAQAVQQQFQLQNHPLNPIYMLPSEGPDISEQQPPQAVSNRSHLDIAHPTPQGHRHNVSETLQKEIDEAESHLEDSIERQLEEMDDDHNLGAYMNDLGKSQWADLSSFKSSNRDRSSPLEESKGDAVPGQGKLIASKYEEKHEGSDIDTNPSLSGDAVSQEHTSSDQLFDKLLRPPHQQHAHKPTLNATAAPFHFQQSHKSKPSTLNVEAKEFKFNPRSRFTAGNFSFTGTSFNPPSSQFNPSASTFDPISAKYGNPSSNRIGLNVAAPAFTPAAQPSRGLPSGEFSFSSAFNVDAAPFKPSQSFAGDTCVSGQSSSEEPSEGGPRIFGKVDLTRTSGPVRRSKAVPIVRPDADMAGEIDGMCEDENGRLAPSLSRSKKARRGGSGSDQEPVYAVSSQPLNESAQTQSPNRDAPDRSPAHSPGKENVTPQSSPHGSGNLKLAGVSKPDRIDPLANIKEASQSEDAWSPFEFRDRDDAANFNAARPISPSSGRRSRPSKSVEYLTNEDPEYLLHESVGDSATPRRHEHTMSKRSAHSISPLSANARPSQMNSPIPQYEYISKISDEDELGGNKIEKSREPNLAHSPPESIPSVPDSPQRAWEQDVSEPEVDSGALNESQETPSLSLDAEPERQILYPDMSLMPVHHDTSLGPSYQEIDDVMKHLNDEDSDLGVEKTQTPWTHSSPMRPGRSQLEGFTPAQQLRPTANLRSDAPSPTPRRAQQLYQHPQQDSTDIDLQSRSETVPARTFGLGIQAPIRRLNDPVNTVVSDWDGALSSEDEVKLQHRSQFFDSHVNNIIGGILDSRLGPLEKSVNVIQQSVAQLAKRSTSQRARRSLSADVENSDADDEDDEEKAPMARSISPRRKDRRAEGLKVAVLEALATHQLSNIENPHPVDLSRIHEVLAEMKLLAEPAALQARASELKGVVEDVISTHPRLRGNRIAGDPNNSAEKLRLQIDGLESMLRIANDRAEEEYRSRRMAEDELAEVRRSLQLAEEEAAQHRESAEDAEQSLRAFHEDKQLTLNEALGRASSLEDQLDDLHTTTAQLSEKNAALDSTLAEYRLSSDEWRQDLDEAKGENIHLLKTIEKIKHQLEENMDSSKKMSSKFERLQEEMVTARRDVAHEQSSWRRREEDLLLKHETLQDRFEKEVRLNEKLELEVEQLEAQERDGSRVKIAFDQTQQEMTRLEEIITKLRHESFEHEGNAARVEREFNDARESARLEVQRITASLEAANNQVNNLDTEIARLQVRLDSVKLDADTQHAKDKLLLEEAHDARRVALGEAAQTREATMQEQHRVHERALNDLRERHGRALHNASEDKERIESHLSELLVLETSKNEHLQDKIMHLEEKLEISKSAALAAVQAAQSTKLPVTVSPSRPSSSTASMLHPRDSGIPEKISPQALRESIISLQEQLHEREGRIELLEQELSEVDKDAPIKIKYRDTEITWLRELLGVRVDDLQDIINTLSEPEYDQDAVRDAAIRLKTNLQMEQQEKERAIAGGQRFPSLDLISNLASPRALPRAATFAMERFNKVRDSSISSSLSDMASMGGETPSRITSGAQSFFSSWMNTPTAIARSNPLNLSTPSTITTVGGRRISTESRPLGAYNAQRSASARKLEKQPEVFEGPSTPSLTRHSSYDLDAEDTILGASMYGDENRRPLEGYSSRDPHSSNGTFSP